MPLRSSKTAMPAPYRGPGADALATDSNPLGVLSMHQPWASLLVYGIKRIEGRSWSTKHRGRLWIHATSTQPEDGLVQELEKFYTEVHAAEGRTPEFPKSYPTSALLGTVDVFDCVTSGDVKAWAGLPDNLKLEAQSAQAWLCENPRRLVLAQKMRGHPLIWELPQKTLEPLVKALKEPPGTTAFTWSDFPAISVADPQATSLS